MSQIFARYGEWIYRSTVLIAMAAFWIGNARSNYATKADLTNAIEPVRTQMEAIVTQVTGLDKSLALLAEQNKVNGRQDDVLRDLELRLRIVEHKP